MQFSYITNKTSRQAKLCTRDDFYRLVNDPRVTELVTRCRAGDAGAKGELPAFLFHATFEGEQRGNQWAVPSGLYMLDFDHLQDPPAQVWERMQTLPPAPPVEGGEQQQSVMQRIESLGIQMVHVTPSGQGLRIVAKMMAGHPELKTIADWQQWLYRQLNPGQELPLDTCVKDFARLSFVVPLSEFLYLDDNVFKPSPFPLPSREGSDYKSGGTAQGVTAQGVTEETLSPRTGQSAGQGVGARPLSLGEINVDVINNHLRYRPYKPSKRHAWWVDFGQYLRFKGIAQEHVAAYITCMKMQLLFNKLVATDDPINRSPNEVKEAVLWGWEHGNNPKIEEPIEDSAFEVSEEDKAFKYRDHSITEIAEAWILFKGEPKMGERHQFYYQMVKFFRFITDNNNKILFAQLPDLGLPEAERWRLCDHNTKLGLTEKIPYEFYRFLTDNGYKEKFNAAAQDTSAAEPSETAETPVALPKLPPIIKEFVDIAPPDFKVPMVFALFPVLGTLATRLRAYASNGNDHSPSATSVIYAPQSSGKSFVRRLDRVLLTKLRERDQLAYEREEIYRRELEVKKNAKVLPKDPQILLRVVEGVISVPQLCTRQRHAKGLHQFSLLEELDTLTKSNKGGSWADKSDLYRVAYDNGYYGQDYKNTATFSGSVQLHYNLLICGTPGQVKRFFSNPEDGLVSRICFCEIKNRLFAGRDVWKQFTKKQQETIDRVVDRLLAQTYGEDDMILPEKWVDMSWVYKPLDKWVDSTLQEAKETYSVSMSQFRWRAAVNAFRYALICSQLYAQLNEERKKLIIDFAVWFAEQDLKNRMDLFAAPLEAEIADQVKISPKENLYKMLPSPFRITDVESVCIKLGIKSQPPAIVSLWIKENMVVKQQKGVWLKLK